MSSNNFDIDKYRNQILSEEDEWNANNCGKKISIEMLENIEIRKRGIGSLKKKYTSSNSEEGPYYDPLCNHVHIWKSCDKILNFQGEQFKNSEYVQFGNEKKGLYCSICHIRNVQYIFKWRPEPDSNFNLAEKKFKTEGKKKIGLDKDKVIFFPDVVEKKELVVENKILNKWRNILFKVKYMANNNKILYKISDYKSLLKWPWELTYYQKFKLKNPDYQESPIFLKPDINKFSKNYAIIN